jgi:hypothetical protein
VATTDTAVLSGRPVSPMNRGCSVGSDILELKSVSAVGMGSFCLLYDVLYWAHSNADVPPHSSFNTESSSSCRTLMRGCRTFYRGPADCRQSRGVYARILRAMHIARG